MRKNLKTEVAELEGKIAELERKSAVLEEKYQKLTRDSDVLLLRYGSQISRRIDEAAETRMNEIELRILQKLVDGDMFELKVKKPNKTRQKRAL